MWYKWRLQGLPACPASPLPSAFPLRLLASAQQASTALPPLQVKEELAAAYARRTPVLVAEPALCLELPEELQQPPPRLDMCSACARLIQEVRVRHGCGKVVSWQ